MYQISGYKITKKIYEGNKNVIYRAYHKSKNKDFIIKMPNSEHPDLSVIAMLKHEYEINNMINSDKVAKIYDIEYANNIPMLIMEDFGGISLSEYIYQNELDVEQFLILAKKIAEALYEIHKCNIVHNDINPKNIIINVEKQKVKIIDLGISSVLSKENREIDDNQHIMGTIYYISPEQTGRMNCPIDFRSDFYSLGVTYYEMLLRKLPFEAEDELGMIHCHLARKPISPSEINKDIPEVVSNIIMKLMEKMIENRYQTLKGLIFDLQKCLNYFYLEDKFQNFELGTNDFSGRFQIPQKMYGRKEEFEILLKSFENICYGEKEVVLVSGYPGVGKTVLVNEIHKSVARSSGYYICGKFQEFKQDIPYYALVSALNDLFQQILTESKDSVEQWKDKLKSVLGDNGQILIDVIPELENVIGKQKDVVEVPPEEARTRFNNMFISFLKMLCTKEHPIVIFLDDIQWIDLSTLRLIELVLNDYEIKYLLFILGYREAYVDKTHPLMVTIENIEKNVNIRKIFLKPLELIHIKEMLAETFKSNVEDVSSLAELSLEKTGGNPFFLNQFLQSLYENQLIVFDNKYNRWKWDLYGIQSAVVTDNVVDLISERIQKFSKKSQEVLKLASCIGMQFDLRTLSVVYGKTMKETYDDMWEILQEGLVVVNGDVFSLVNNDKNAKIIYTFLHERIKQSAYSLIENKYKKQIHLKIGRLMLSNINYKNDEKIVLDIVNHFNLALELISELTEKKDVAELELYAGRTAKKANAYDEAYKYLVNGIKLVGESDFNINYELNLALYLEAAEIAAILGNFEVIEIYTSIVLSNSKNVIDKVRAYEVRLTAYWAQNMIVEAVNTALVALKLLGINFPKNPKPIHIWMSLMKMRMLLWGKSSENLINLPVMKNKHSLAAERIFIKASLPVLKNSPYLFLLMILKSFELCIKYGNPEGAHTFYNGYGMVLCVTGDIKSGYEFGNIALKIMEKQNQKGSNAQTIVSFNSYISYLKNHVKDTLVEFVKAHRIGMETGNIDYACTSACMYGIYSFYAGNELSSLEKEVAFYEDIIRKSKNTEAINTQAIYHQTILNLIGEGKNAYQLRGKVYDENKMIPEHISVQDKLALSYAYINKAILSYLFSQYDKALENVEFAQKYVESANGILVVPVFYFYQSLILLTCYNKASNENKEKFMKMVVSNQKKLKKLSESAPMNFLHKYYLVEAERANILKNELKTVELYNIAIELAAKNEYIQEEALANELMAKYYVSRGKDRLARAFMKDAIYCYKLWGASAKVSSLETEYPFLLVTGPSDMKKNMKNTSIISEGKTSSISGALDISSILKATQAISGEIILEELFKKLVYILLESAGAQYVTYLTKKDGKYIIQAKGMEEENNIEVLKDSNVEAGECLPEKIIAYTDHTKESVILDNASEDEKYMNDIYISKNKSKSILCMPVLSKGDIIGILYLENNLIEGAFSIDRVEILKVVASQLAISLENANLYNNLEELVEERTRELKEEIIERRKIQKQLEEMATHDNLTGLANRKLFQDRLIHSLESAKRNNSNLSVLYIDLDGFKAVNDTLGHDSGDMVLIVVTERFLSCVRSCDMVSRLGGDEFTIIIEGLEDVEDIIIICNRIIDEVKKPIKFGENEVFVTASIGISSFPEDGSEINTLIKKADDAMYYAKKSGKNRYIFANQLSNYDTLE